jgi:hypothetical protein
LTEQEQISLVPPQFLDDAWEHVKDYIEVAVEQTDGRYTIEDAYTLVKERGYLLWVALGEHEMKGAVITCFLHYPRKKALHIMFLGGAEGRAWKEAMLKMLQRFAKDQSCDIIEASGREGWSRVLKQDGFTPLWHTFELPVEPMHTGVH